MAFTASGAAARIASRSTDSSRTGTMFRPRSSARRNSPPHPVVLVGAAVQRAGGQQQEKVRPLRDLCEDLFRPLACIDTVNVQEDVVATSCERPFDQPGKKVARPCPAGS